LENSTIFNQFPSSILIEQSGDSNTGRINREKEERRKYDQGNRRHSRDLAKSSRLPQRQWLPESWPQEPPCKPQILSLETFLIPVFGPYFPQHHPVLHRGEPCPIVESKEYFFGKAAKKGGRKMKMKMLEIKEIA